MPVPVHINEEDDDLLHDNLSFLSRWIIFVLFYTFIYRFRSDRTAFALAGSVIKWPINVIKHVGV